MEIDPVWAVCDICGALIGRAGLHAAWHETPPAADPEPNPEPDPDPGPEPAPEPEPDPDPDPELESENA